MLMSAKKVGPKRKRVLDAINHRTPDRVPMDFGGSAVSGMHVSCVAKLRDHYGLEKRLVKVHEPYQMLGLIEDDLKEAIGIDVTPLTSRTNMFGFENRDWKPWTFNGLEVLVPEGFRVSLEPEKGGTLIYPKGDVSAPPSAHMPKDGFFFDSIIRQKPIDLDHLNPEDNAEQYQPLTDAQLDAIEEDARPVDTGEYAVFASLVNTALGDIAFVPGPDLTDPKGVRDVAEWYMLTASHPEVVHKIFERQVAVGIENMAKIHARVGDAIDVIFLCGTDFGTQTSTFCSVKTFELAVEAALRRPLRLDPQEHDLENLQALVRRVRAFFRVDDRRRDRHHQSGSVLGEGHGPEDAEGEVQGPARLLGRRRRHAEDPALRHAGRGARRGAPALRDLLRGRRLRVQRDPQRPGRHAGGEHGCDDRSGEGVQRGAGALSAAVIASEAKQSTTTGAALRSWIASSLRSSQ